LALIMLAVIPIANGNIEIETLPDHDVQLTLVKDSQETPVVLERLEGKTDSTGKVTLETTTNENFDILFFVKKDGETIISEKYLENYDPNKDIEISSFPEGYVAPAKETTINYYKILKYVVILAAIIIIILIILMLIASENKKSRKRYQERPIKIIKMSEFRKRQALERKQSEKRLPEQEEYKKKEIRW